MWAQRMRLGLGAILLLAGCSDAGSDPDTEADEPRAPSHTTCRGSLGPEVIEGDLIVPAGKRCELDRTKVRGRVTVEADATLVARKARFGGGVSAHGFERVELQRVWPRGDSATWRGPDYVFDRGRHLVIRGGDSDASYYVLGNTGRVEIRSLSLDLGGVYCAGNTRPPVVRGVAGETPGVLKGQCAGLKNFGETDF